MEATLIPAKNKLPTETMLVEAAPSSQRRLLPKQLLIDALLLCALAAFLILGVVNVGALLRYPSISLRYSAPLSGQAAYQARQYSIEHSGDETFWPVFWHETQARFESENNSADAVCIMYSGDAALVFSAQYLMGAAPGVTDGAGCAVSSALAWDLWGGFDVAGKTVEVGGETRTVRGVFEGGDLLALVSVRDEDTSQGFTAVELSGGPADSTRSDVESFSRASGLGSPGSILMGTPTSVAAILAALPLAILAVYGLGLLVARMRSRPAALRGFLLLAFLGFAFMLPGLLDKLPGWVIPTRWSDFSFWGSLARQVGNDLREYFTLSPSLRDVAYKMLLLKQLGLAFVSTCLALSFCFRWHIRYRALITVTVA